MEELFSTHSLLSFATLTILEIVLGIDNIVFLAILTGKLPERDQPRADRGLDAGGVGADRAAVCDFVDHHDGQDGAVRIAVQSQPRSAGA